MPMVLIFHKPYRIISLSSALKTHILRFLTHSTVPLCWSCFSLTQFRQPAQLISRWTTCLELKSLFFWCLVWMLNVSRVHAAIPACAGWAGFHYLHLCRSSWALICTSRRLLGAISFSFNMCIWRFVHLASPFNLIDMLLPCFVCSRLCRDGFFSHLLMLL